MPRRPRTPLIASLLAAACVGAGGGALLYSAFGSNGNTTVVRPARKFIELAKNEFDDGFMASPAVTGKALILRTKSALYRVEE